MANTVIQLKKSATPSAAPTSLANGELALNFADGKLFYKHANGTITPFNTSGGGGNAFGSVDVDGTLIVADTTSDVLSLVSGTNITLTACTVTDTITISATGTGGTVTTSDTAPVSPGDGDLWWNSSDGKLYIYYDDGSSSQWVEASPTSYSVGGGTGSPTDISPAFAQANIARDHANAAFLQANTADDHANLAFAQANTARNHANVAFNRANSVSIVYVIDGGGSVITAGQKGHLEIPFACTIDQWTILLDQSGSIQIEVWADTYANFPPTSADSINATPYTVTTAVKAQGSTDPTNSVLTAGEILAYNVVSATTTTRATISLRAVKT